MKIQRLLLAVCLVLGLAPQLLDAQGTSGTITGQIIDPSGAAITGARVTATNTATNVASIAETTASGDYAVTVNPGTYRISVESEGFKRAVQNEVIVTASSSVRLDIALELGAVSESVEVQANAIMVQSENSKISTAVENKFVDELPLVVSGTLRSPFNLVTIAAQANEGNSTNLSLGGAQSGAWNATMDGLSIATNRSANQEEIAYVAPSVEAITEVAVDTNGFKAEYGQAGGGVLTFSTKSGTNEFHGTAYEFLRNEKLDARGFFASSRSALKQHDFGAAGGGPILRNRTFFFLAYEGFRNREGANATIRSVPTPEMYAGDFSNWIDANGKLIQIYDPASTRVVDGKTIRDPFPNNRIPRERFSPLATRFAEFGRGVTPNRGAQPGSPDYVRNNFITTQGTIESPQDKGSMKIDHLLTQDHRLAFFMNITKFRTQPGSGGPPGLPGVLWDGQVQRFDTSTYRVSHDWVISPSVLNSFTIGGNLFNKESFGLGYQGEGGDWATQAGCIPNVIDCNRNFPQLSFSEFSTWGGVARNGTEQPMWALKDDISFIRGKHSFKGGFSFQNQRANGFGEQCIMGCVGFSFNGTSVPGNTNFTSGSSFASFLLGHASSSQTETVRFVEQIYNYYGLYFQDDWRINSKFTLNLGLRYDYTQPPFSARDEYSDFTPDRPNPAVNGYPGALRFSGFGPGRENTRTLVPSWWGGWGPRIGFAYAPDSKSSIRAGFGRSFSRVTVVSGSGHFAGFIGTYNFNTLDNGITPGIILDKGLPPYPLPVSLDPSAELNPAFANNQNVDYWQPSDAARAPENYYWTFSMQREVAQNTIVELGYAANVGAHLQAGLVNINQVPTAIWNDLVSKHGTTKARDILRANITSTLAKENGFNPPYANFTDPSVQTVRTVAQALRPYPQYNLVRTGSQGGDKSGHSSYHSLIAKMSRRYANGLAFEWNYVFSKMLTDTDRYNEGDGDTMDQYNRRLEKSISEFDQTHVAKFSTVYELPFGRGRALLSNINPVVDAVIGGWRISAIQQYASGYPIALTRNNPLPIFNRSTRPFVTSYDDWRGAESPGGFDPATDRFLNKSVFPAQPLNFGNVTRFNPKVRQFPILNENVSLAKTFSITERFRLDFRAEAFNLFNRVRFGTGSTNLDSNTFGVVTNQANDPRSMQLGLKLYF